jgi:antitoxin HicB
MRKTMTMTEPIKTIDYYLSLPYPIELIPDEDGYWFAQIPLLRGCMTQGASREEALTMLDEAKQLWLEVSLERGHVIPEPEPVGVARQG